MLKCQVVDQPPHSVAFRILLQLGGHARSALAAVVEGEQAPAAAWMFGGLVAVRGIFQQRGQDAPQEEWGAEAAVLEQPLLGSLPGATGGAQQSVAVVLMGQYAHGVV